MKRFYRLIPVVLVTACLYSAGCTAGPNVSAISGVPIKVVLSDVPDQSMVEAFTRKAEENFPDYGEGKVPVSDRILDGFEAAPSQLAMADGSSVRWGFKNQEANLQSLVISDKSGQLALLAAVDGVTRLTTPSTSPINKMAQYQRAVENSGMTPSVTVFVHDEGVLKAYLPLLKRWLQADLLGFEAKCSQVRMAGSCKLAEQITLPMTVYIIVADGSLRSIKAPVGKADSVPLESFVQ